MPLAGAEENGEPPIVIPTGRPSPPRARCGGCGASALRRRPHKKGQEASEQRNSAFKGPLEVNPIYLENNKRIHGPLHVVGLALLLFSLIEREVRRSTGPTGTVAGLYAGRPAKPTGRLLLKALSGLRLAPARDGQLAYIPRPTPLQRRVLNLLKVDPTKPP